MMRWFVALATVGLARQAHANTDDIDGFFVSAGASISYGTRGLVLGFEISSGTFSNQDGTYAGGAIGIDFAVDPPPRAPSGRAYLEAELGYGPAGVGAGPALFFGGEDVGPHFQITPYAGLPVARTCSEPWVVVSPFFRYTTRGEQRGLFEGGTFVKGLGFPNGRNDSLCGNVTRTVTSPASGSDSLPEHGVAQ